MVLAPALAAGCASHPDRDTLATLRSVEPDVAEVEVANTLDLAMQSYRKYLDETPTSAMTPEAMRRLADLQLEKEFGLTGDGGRWVEWPRRGRDSRRLRCATHRSTPRRAPALPRSSRTRSSSGAPRSKGARVRRPARWISASPSRTRSRRRARARPSRSTSDC